MTRHVYFLEIYLEQDCVFDGAGHVGRRLQRGLDGHFIDPCIQDACQVVLLVLQFRHLVGVGGVIAGGAAVGAAGSSKGTTLEEKRGRS